MLAARMTGKNSPYLSFAELEKLQEVYGEIDERVALFQKLTGLRCLPNCRKCCETAKTVEVSILEMLPLAQSLWERGEAESLLERLKGIDEDHPCVLLDRSPSPDKKGGCTHYSLRPLICRLFGFSALRDKHGNPRIALCRPLKDQDPSWENRINEKIQNGLPVPIIPDFSMKAAMIHPSLGQRRYPINYSLKEALEIIGQRLIFIKKS